MNDSLNYLMVLGSEMHDILQVLSGILDTAKLKMVITSKKIVLIRNDIKWSKTVYQTVTLHEVSGN
jgi:hypothetical protein